METKTHHRFVVPVVTPLSLAPKVPEIRDVLDRLEVRDGGERLDAEEPLAPAER